MMLVGEQVNFLLTSNGTSGVYHLIIILVIHLVSSTMDCTVLNHSFSYQVIPARVALNGHFQSMLC